MSRPFIIMSAPNGARRQKTDHPELPITPDDMAICAYQILDAGASILHLHVRDDDGGHSLDVERYRASISAIKNAVGDQLIIQTTSEAVGFYSRHEQMAMTRELKPEAISLALRELCPADGDIAEFSKFNQWIKAEKIFPQYILYNESDFDRFEKMRKQGVFHDDTPFTLFVFGSYQGDYTNTDQLKEKSLAAKFPWAACGFYENEKECISHAALNDGHIRVGFENNIRKDENTLLENNAEMIRYSAKIASQAQRNVATASDVRNMFNLKE
ncbi:MAG: 3-keto-5-aminohexanoate cleavage protein [Kordiimonadaceae bacterium]|nr:3-keto-5-aminohexanoate cleavage protein [Kordiimonadaceae bacterium]MBT6037589.1 3-keto-5-aminohexanoate cleavage protein [Kordiimonadaceae bacterium]MBT6330618.1 3-keto-5-aminohexanoate cleavage protein [Kordiimonadaceae bacterium]MBT7582326.1 3-keto-5-aminohexanoate cleavage protein [Kordiimonadaceae bacterium]